MVSPDGQGGGAGDAEGSNGSSWEALLRAAMSKARPTDSTVLFVGQSGCGKTSLLKRFNAISSSSSSHGSSSSRRNSSSNRSSSEDGANGKEDFHPILSYQFFDAVDPLDPAKDDSEDSPARVNVWSCSEREFSDLLGTVLEPSHLAHTLAVVTVDLTRPRLVKMALEEWTAMLDRLVTSKLSGLSIGERDGLKANISAYVAKACSSSSSSSSGVPNAATDSPLDPDVPPLPPGVLETNLSIPLVVVGCKSDALPRGNYDRQQEQLYMQQYMRRFCLRHGAALVYTSAADGVNCLELQRYILHRCCPSTAVHGMNLEARVGDELFIPSGWDSSRLIDDILPVNKVSGTELETLFDDALPPVASSPVKGGHQQRRSSLEGFGRDGGALVPEEEWLEDLRSRQVKEKRAPPAKDGRKQTGSGADAAAPAGGGGASKTADVPAAPAAAPAAAAPAAAPKDFFLNLLNKPK